ncbi:hypothetical protein CANMA_003632 [Candida margitis]|uniref:uncharacterized protein n=1 Tax=Candida margitis TaxID=1775924 RepID=UPI0022276695|nr:uncharacterized protein CANMA_003632 [Candida margitis]KAI5962857.1 hypothetical protein CANMA_003632 [Candida margitis]
MTPTVQKIIKDRIDLYKILEISSKASTEEIRRAYHKQALIHHPDKQVNHNDLSTGSPSASSDKFDLVLTSFQVLSDKSLRKQYNRLIHMKSPKTLKRARDNGLIKKFQDDLLSKEQNHKVAVPRRAVNIEQLHEDGIKKRRIYEERANTKPAKANVSIHDLPLLQMLDFETNRQFIARLKYKYRPELHIDESIITEIMSTFGKVKQVELLNVDDNYAYAKIHFDNINDLNEAVDYDYSTAQKWDGTGVRKLASLLRSCKKEYGPEGKEWTDNPTVNAVLDQYVQSVSDKKAISF